LCIHYVLVQDHDDDLQNRTKSASIEYLLFDVRSMKCRIYNYLIINGVHSTINCIYIEFLQWTYVIINDEWHRELLQMFFLSIHVHRNEQSACKTRKHQFICLFIQSILLWNETHRWYLLSEWVALCSMHTLWTWSR
jgi:hypothetical protein